MVSIDFGLDTYKRLHFYCKIDMYIDLLNYIAVKNAIIPCINDFICSTFSCY